MGLPKDCSGMGFRDLVSFNKALLAKQCWQLMKSPESLIARILKAKYYPHTSFMEANLGTNHLLHGEVSKEPETLLRLVLFGELEMAI